VKVLVWELRKLRAQLPVRAAFVVCLLGPVLLGVVLAAQSGLPKDTLFGRHVHESGYALPLVILGFAGTWGFPLLAGICAGDVFSSEDNHRTWPLLATRSRSRSEMFSGKVLAASAVAVGLLGVVAFSSTATGLVLAGSHPLTGLSGDPLSGVHALVLVLASWASTAPALLGFVALASLLSVVSRNSVVGVGGPVVLGLFMQLLALLGGLGRLTDALLTTPFAAWHGLVREHPFVGPLWQGVLVSALWTVACLLPARATLLRRDLT
jgi:ABC-2 type transport system permease protein